MEEPVFDVLRTREQLGYNVYATLRNTFGVLGFSITVDFQADKFRYEVYLIFLNQRTYGLATILLLCNVKFRRYFSLPTTRYFIDREAAGFGGNAVT